MNERDLQVVEQYPFQVNGVWRTRGAFMLDTDRGRLLIREFGGSEYKLQKEQELLSHLRDRGYLVDQIVNDREGRQTAVYREHDRYVVKEAMDGRECDIRSESEILQAVSLLAKLHLAMREAPGLQKEDRVRLQGPDLGDELRRHNRELKKIYNFIRQKNRKNEFEAAYLSCFPKVFEEAQRAVRLLQESGYEDLRREALEKGYFCHGEYSHHNILVNGSRMAVINFEHLCLDVQVNDLYFFLRKILEKQNYDLSLGHRMLRAYEAVCPLSEEEKKFLSLRLCYPEKFWKLANYYYNTNKVWIPGKHMEKLEKFLAQQEKRVHFSSDIIYNRS